MAELVRSLNDAAGTAGLEAAGAANVLAGATGMEVVGALNVAAGNARPDWRELAGVLNQLAGTTGLDAAAAAALIQTTALLTESGLRLTTETGSTLVREA